MVLFLGVSWSLPSGLASGTSMNTFGSSYNTLTADVIKRAWLDIFYLMHVLYVVYVATGAPPPTSLVYYLNVHDN